MTFQFRRRYGLFTYAQCGGLDPFAVCNHFASLRAECIIGREDHADGGTHLHCFVDFNREFSSRDPRFADVEGFHPNVLPGRKTPEKMWDYATKDGDVVAGGLERPDGSGVPRSRDVWHDIILAESRAEFFELCAELAPRALACSYNSLRAYADWKYRPVRLPYSTPSGVRIDTTGVGELDDWVRENLVGHQSGGELSCSSAVVCSGTGFPPFGGSLPNPLRRATASGRMFVSLIGDKC